MRRKFTCASYQVLGIVAKPPYRSGPGLPLDRLKGLNLASSGIDVIDDVNEDPRNSRSTPVGLWTIA
jgi:hypothetical protein